MPKRLREEEKDKLPQELCDLDSQSLLRIIEELHSTYPSLYSTIEKIIKDKKIVCGECGATYTLKDQKEDACRYHPGELEECDESDHWPDWDDEVHGPPIGSDESKREYAENYIYDCCGEHGRESSGCKTAPHTPHSIVF